MFINVDITVIIFRLLFVSDQGFTLRLRRKNDRPLQHKH